MMMLPVLVRVPAVMVVAVSAALGSSARADLFAIHDDTGDLYSISESDATVTLIGSSGVPHLGSLEFAPTGVLYGFTYGVNAALYSIDPATAQATRIGALNLGTEVFEGGLAFAPNGTAYGVSGGTSSAPLLFNIDLTTGQAGSLLQLDGGSHDIGGLAWRSGGVTDGRGDGAGRLIGLDRISAAILEINPSDATTGILAELNEGITTGVISGMAAVNPYGPQGASLGYFSTAVTGTNALYWFDPATGAHGLVSEFDPEVVTGAGFGGLAYIPEPASLATLLLGAAALVSKGRRRSSNRRELPF